MIIFCFFNILFLVGVIKLLNVNILVLKSILFFLISFFLSLFIINWWGRIISLFGFVLLRIFKLSFCKRYVFFIFEVFFFRKD